MAWDSVYNSLRAPAKGQDLIDNLRINNIKGTAVLIKLVERVNTKPLRETLHNRVLDGAQVNLGDAVEDLPGLACKQQWVSGT
jgi:hypothetical protein